MSRQAVLSSTLMRRLAFPFVFALLVAACGPGAQDRQIECSDQAAAPPDGKMLVRLGYGSDGEFQPIRDGDAIPVDHGSQGGSHIWLNVQSWAPKKSLLNYVVELTDADGNSVGTVKGNASTCGAGWVTVKNDRLVFDSMYWTGSPPKAPLKLTIAESDGVGTNAGQELKITLR